MVGTAVAFNLQSHAALVVIGTELGGFTEVWHDLGVHVLAGIAYVFALLLFPDGSIDRSRGPHLMGLAVFFGLFSFIAIDGSHECPRAAVRRARPGGGAPRALATVPRGPEPGAPPALPPARGGHGGVAGGCGGRAHGHLGAQVERRAVHRDDARLRVRRAGGGHVHLLLRPAHRPTWWGRSTVVGADLVRSTARGSCRSRPTASRFDKEHASSSWPGRPA